MSKLGVRRPTTGRYGTKTPEWEALRAADPARATAIKTRATAKAKELAAA